MYKELKVSSNPPGMPPGAPPAGNPPGGKPPGPGKPQQPATWDPGAFCPPDLKFQMVGDLLILDAEMLKVAMAAVKGKGIPVPLLQLINANPQVQAFVTYLIAAYPAPVAAVFQLAAGYVIHAAGLKQQEAKGMVTTKARLV